MEEKFPYKDVKNDLQPGDRLVYEHKQRDKYGEAEVLEDQTLRDVTSKQVYTSPTKWIEESVVGKRSVPVGGYLNYVSVVSTPKAKKKLFDDEKKQPKKPAAAAPKEKRTPFSKEQRREILQSTGNRCYLCKGAIAVGEKWHVEHIVAFSKNPGNAISQQSLICQR